MLLPKNSLVLKIYERGILIKEIDGLHVSVDIDNIGLNLIPTASISIKGLDPNFSKKLAGNLNKIGIIEAIYSIEVFAGRGEGTNKLTNDLVFSGSLIGGDIFGPPDNSLKLEAKVGVELFGSIAIYTNKQPRTIQSFLSGFIAASKGSNVFNQGFFKPLIVETSKNLKTLQVNSMVIEGDFNSALNKLIEIKPNIRYVFGVKGNVLSVITLGEIEKIHVIDSREIINSVETDRGVDNIKVTGFFNNFRKIKVGDGVRLSSSIKSYLTFTYQVVGMSIQLANKEANKWHITLRCRVVRF